jgi:hypothetical protein
MGCPEFPFLIFVAKVWYGFIFVAHTFAFPSSIAHGPK